MPEDSLGIPIPDPDVVDLDAAPAVEERAREVGWPGELQLAYENLRQVKPERVVNATYLGDLAFTDAGSRLEDTVQILTDLQAEDWGYIRPIWLARSSSTPTQPWRR